MSDERKGGVDASEPLVELVTQEDFERRSRELSTGIVEAGAEEEAVEVVRPDAASAATAAPAASEMVEAPRRALVQKKADLQMRTLGRAIDLVIFAIVAESISYLGPVVALTYLLLADGIFDGASLGKKITKLQVIRTKDAKPANLIDSLLRNAPLGIAGLFVLIPIVGWALFLTLGLAIILFESYMAWKDPHGIRAGDILAGTQVTAIAAQEPPPADENGEGS